MEGFFLLRSHGSECDEFLASGAVWPGLMWRCSRQAKTLEGEAVRGFSVFWLRGQDLNL
jgi:hypothetical protein